MNIPPELEAFTATFNLARYWESHEVLEPAWRRTRSRFYHGLILYASAWVHAERGNRTGVLAQLDKADPVLVTYRPAYLGVDLDQLVKDSHRLREDAETGRLSELTRAPIRLESTLVRGDEPELSDSV
ncbi:MAG: DUF309 domain-containing protein [Gemmatimonadota bacterium]